MSQKILSESWVDEFVSESWAGDRARGHKLAARLQEQVRHAMKVLDSTPVGAEVVFEGSCPSGSTYEGRCRWDGSEEMREGIAQDAYRLGGFDGNWLVCLDDVPASYSAAGMCIS